MNKKNNTSHSWPVYFPLLLLLGLSIAGAGGFLVQNHTKKGLIQERILKSEDQLRQFTYFWGGIEGRLIAFQQAVNQENNLRQSTFTNLTKSLLQNTQYSIRAIAYFERIGTSYRLRYSQGELIDIRHNEDELNKELNTALEEVTHSVWNNNTFHMLPYAPLNGENLQTQTHDVWLVAPEFLRGDAFVVARVSLDKALALSALEKNVRIGVSSWHATLPTSENKVLLWTDALKSEGIDYSKSIALSGGYLTVNWSYGHEVAKASYVVAGVFVLIVLGTLGLVLWSLLSQHSVARRIQKEVVSRTKELEQAGRKFRLITDNAYDLIAIFSVSGNFEYVNSAYNRVLGYSLKGLYGRHFLDYIHEDEQPYVKDALQAVVDGRPLSEVNFRIKARNNTWIYMEAVAKGVFDNSWNLSSIVLHSRDVTARKRYADQLARSEQRFKDFADSSADWLWETDQDYNFSYVSPGIKTTLGFLSQDMVGKNIFTALFTKYDDTTRELIEELSQRHQPYREVEFWTRTRTGERVCLRLSGVPVFDTFGHFSGYRGAATNITSSKVDSENMLRLATTDHLTGLLNRNRFMEELENTVALARRHGTEGVVLFLDLDRFKAVNDTHGHAAGDAVIRSIASLLRRSVRSTDVISRLAGDEFALIMHNIDVETARKKVKELLRKIGQTQIEYHNARLQMTASIGMVAYPQGAKDASQLLTSADLAMYRAKDMGRNRMYVDEEVSNSDKTSATVREQLEWLDRLRIALAEDTFEMHFQPIVPCHVQQPVIYEALIRLRDENGKLGAPGLFIDAAEHFGMIRDLDKAVVSRCIKMQAALAKEGQTPTISMNISGVSFGDHELLYHLKDEFVKYGADPSKFIFEVTETAAMRDIDQARSFVSALKQMGSQFALDDFGVGFSSFFYIKHLSVDYIKIDGSYIKNLDTSREDRLFVKSLVDLAAGLNIKTVAEFVENKAILDELIKMDVTYAQGYYISRPEESLPGVYKIFDGKTAQGYHAQKIAPKVVKLLKKEQK